jgi:hypothetical protein
MSQTTFTATKLATISAREAVDLHFDYERVLVQFQNGYKPVLAPFTVTIADDGFSLTVNSDEHGPFDIRSPKYNNLYMHNLESCTFYTD